MKKKPRILIIEDDKFIANALTFKLKREGFEIKTVITAEDGLKILKLWKPSIILLDLVLTGIDGYAFLREVRLHPKWKDMPVIVTTNIGEDPDLQPGDVTEYKEYIVKDELNLEELAEKLKKYI